MWAVFAGDEIGISCHFDGSGYLTPLSVFLKIPTDRVKPLSMWAVEKPWPGQVWVCAARSVGLNESFSPFALIVRTETPLLFFKYFILF